jgi:hypothetical protein
MMRFVGGVLVVWLLGALGWVLNVVWLCQCDFKPSYKAEIVRGVGVFVPPVGAVLGYVPMEDGQ